MNSIRTYKGRRIYWEGNGVYFKIWSWHRVLNLKWAIYEMQNHPEKKERYAFVKFEETND